MDIINWILDNGLNIIAAVQAVLLSLIGLFLLIPGPHPEDWLRKIADFMAIFSRK